MNEVREWNMLLSEMRDAALQSYSFTVSLEETQ